MNEFHILPLDCQRFFSSATVRRMRWDERGAYAVLLMEAWLQGGSLPADYEEIRALLGVDDDDDWRRIRRFVLDRCFVSAPSEDGVGRLVNPALAETLEDVRRRTGARRDAARQAAQARWQRRSEAQPPAAVESSEDGSGVASGDGAKPEQCEGNANAMRTQCKRNAKAMPKEKEEEKEKKDTPPVPPTTGGNRDGRKNVSGRRGRRTNGTEVPIPDALANDDEFIAVWAEFQQWRRKEKHQTMTPTAKKLMLKKLAKYPVQVAIEALKQSMTNDWIGVFPQNVRIDPGREVKVTPAAGVVDGLGL